MAINFLNSIELNGNELLNSQLIKAQVENQPNNAAAGTGQEGQIYYDTTLDVLKVWAGGAWTTVGGGVESLSVNDSTFVDLADSGSASDPSLTASLNASGTPSSSTFLRGDNTWSSVPQGDVTGVTAGTKIDVTNPTGPVPIVNHEATSRTDSTSSVSNNVFTVVDSITQDATGHPTAVNVKTVTVPDTNTDTTYTLPVAAGGANSAILNLTAGGSGSGIASSVTIEGTNNQIDVDNTGNVVEFTLSNTLVTPDTLTVGGNFQTNSDVSFTGSIFDVGSSTSIDFGGNRITEVGDPVANKDAANKAYVDNNIAGGLIYQGGYNANTNTPDLDSGSSIAVSKGWTYTVTADGLFFTEQVRVGDVLISEVDQAAGSSSLANWTTVQNNIDIADATTIGIGNVNESSASAKAGIDISYSNGTATVGIDIDNLSDSSADTASDIELFVYDSPEDENMKILGDAVADIFNKETSKAFTTTGSATPSPFSHNFGTTDVIVQLYDQSTGQTVFADVDRTSTSAVTVVFASAPSTNIKVLIQKVG